MIESRARTALAALAAAWVLAAASVSAAASDQGSAAIFTQLPVLTLEEDSTNVARLVGPVRPGDQVVLFFWSTYDRFSREELPAIARFYREHRGDRTFHILTLNLVEMREGADDVRSFLAKEAPDLPVALDPSWRTLQRLQKLAHTDGGSALGLPTLAILDSDGRIVTFQRGATGRTYDILMRLAAARGAARSVRGRG